jgi:hypothetical protein
VRLAGNEEAFLERHLFARGGAAGTGRFRSILWTVF